MGRCLLGPRSQGIGASSLCIPKVGRRSMQCGTATGLVGTTSPLLPVARRSMGSRRRFSVTSDRLRACDAGLYGDPGTSPWIDEHVVRPAREPT